MDSNYRPQSPNIYAIGNAPQSPDLSGLRPQSPDLSQAQPSPRFGGSFQQPSRHFQSPPTSAYYQPPTSYSHPQPSTHYPPPQYFGQQQTYYNAGVMPPTPVKNEDDDEYMPDASAKRTRGVKQEYGFAATGQDARFAFPPAQVKYEPVDPTLGCHLKTSFPVARIKRIMQADEDIGKVAQVTPTVVSRALELFMIKLISGAAHQARGSAGEGSKGPRRVMPQHLKRAVAADEKLDFLQEIVGRVPDAPTKAKKETAGSDSEDAKPKKRGKKRKDSGDDI